MKTAALLLLGAGLLWPGAAIAKTPQTLDGTTLMAELKSSGVDKKRFESYIKRRVAKINDRHKARMDFLAKESDIWNSFWTKVRDERKLFEIRLARQLLDLFESLSSLDANDHALTMADFEKMQNNVVKSFETQQKQKLAEFFAARERRWREFVSQQERERADFLAEAPADWKATRGSEAAPAPARRGKSARPTPASAPDDNSEDASGLESK